MAGGTDKSVPVSAANLQQSTYSLSVAFIYVFNLVVGVGALALPKAFAETGWAIGLIALGVLAIMSYCTATFMVEAMSIANALLHVKQIEQQRMSINGNSSESLSDNFLKDSEENSNEYDNENLVGSKNDLSDLVPNYVKDHESLYEIDVKVEMGEMADMFFNKVGTILYYIVIAMYLYGDLAIYAAAVPKSMTTVICGSTDVFDNDVNLPCENVKDANISVIGMYRIMLVTFAAILGPFVFLNISKTKFLQMFTSLFRWLAFMAMIVLAVIKIVRHEQPHHATMFRAAKLPNFFGVAVYSFMCQHSLPSILTPVHIKKHLNLMLFWDFILITLFYAMVVMTAVFAFSENNIEDLYTLNFSAPLFLRYFLELFPVFTLSTSFPIIGITLRENLKFIFLKGDENQYGLFFRRYLFPLLTVIPPIGIAYFTHDVELLVNFTGAYAGAVIQYVIPVLLVYFGRKHVTRTMLSYQNTYHRSPFSHGFWIYFVIVWYVICFIFVTLNIINSKFHFLPS